MEKIQQLGYYAKDKDNNLHQFEIGSNNKFYINNANGKLTSNLGHKMSEANADEYEIIEVGFFHNC
jgi:hypothetical protein